MDNTIEDWDAHLEAPEQEYPDEHYSGFRTGLKAAYDALLISQDNLLELLKNHNIQINS